MSVFVYATAMLDYPLLLALSNKTERAASRKLAARDAITREAALHATLLLAAGAAGLPSLLARRQQLRDAEAANAVQRTARRAQAGAARQARHAGPANPWRAWFDGSAHPNPGDCGIGGLVTGPAGERVEITRSTGYGNSGEAEYQALIAVLEAAHAAGACALTVYGDSRVVIDDVTGPRHNASAALAGYRAGALVLLARFEQVALQWIPRARNGAADALSQRGAMR